MINYCSTYFQYVNVKIDLLNQELKADEPSEHVINKRLEEIIRTHRIAISMAEKLDEITRVMSLCNFFTNTFNVCFLFFEFGTVSFSIEVPKDDESLLYF